MKKFYYYAKLNQHNICIGIESRVDVLTDVDGYVSIPEYNETNLYRKWENNQWSVETYEPSIDTVLQDKVDAFEITVANLEGENTTLSNQVLHLNGAIAQLEGTIMELTMILATLQGGM